MSIPGVRFGCASQSVQFGQQAKPLFGIDTTHPPTTPPDDPPRPENVPAEQAQVGPNGRPMRKDAEGKSYEAPFDQTLKGRIKAKVTRFMAWLTRYTNT